MTTIKIETNGRIQSFLEYVNVTAVLIDGERVWPCLDLGFSLLRKVSEKLGCGHGLQEILRAIDALRDSYATQSRLTEEYSTLADRVVTENRQLREDIKTLGRQLLEAGKEMGKNLDNEQRLETKLKEFVKENYQLRVQVQRFAHVEPARMNILQVPKGSVLSWFEDGERKWRCAIGSLCRIEAEKLIAAHKISPLINRYHECVSKLWALFPSDPLGDDCEAQLSIERLEALIEKKLLVPAKERNRGPLVHRDYMNAAIEQQNNEIVLLISRELGMPPQPTVPLMVKFAREFMLNLENQIRTAKQELDDIASGPHIFIAETNGQPHTIAYCNPANGLVRYSRNPVKP